MATGYGNVSVTTSATQILPPNNRRKSCLINNNGAATLYIGFDSSVTSSNGMPVVSNGYYINSGENDAFRGAIFGISASGTLDVRYEEVEI